MKIAWPELAPDISLDIQSARGVWSPSGYARVFGRHIIEQRDFLRGRSALDVGCGSGVLAVLLAKLGARTSALDVCREAVQCTRKNAARNEVSVDAFVSDGLGEVIDWVGGDKVFDFVVCNPYSTPGVVMGIDNGEDGRRLLDHVLRKAPYIMRPGGKLLICSNSEQGQELTHNLLDQCWRDYEVLEADVFKMESPIFPDEWKEAWERTGKAWTDDGIYYHTAEFILARK
jgi:release factor glutamine methyltransferase